jgi:hypothetical protein
MPHAGSTGSSSARGDAPTGRVRDLAPVRLDRRSGARGVRFFASPTNEPRSRRASDVLAAAAAFVGLVLLGWIHLPPASFEKALVDLVDAFPDFLDGLWQLSYDLLVLWAAVLLVVALLRRRPALVRDQLVAALAALVVALVFSRAVAGSWLDIWRSLGAGEDAATFPALRLGMAGAAIITASPHLSRPTRRVGRWMLGLGAVSVALLGAATPTAAAGGLLVAVLAAATTHLVFGSCGGRPGLGEVRAALDELGVPLASIGAAAC